MGLSVAIAGAIILSVLMLVMMSMTGLVGNIFSIGSVTTQVSDLENTIDNTDISLETLFASTTPRVNFTLNNDDTEKLWNFDEFNVLIEYESASGDELEELSYGDDCQGTVPSVGEWCIEGIAGDFLDAGILNEGESAEVWTQVSQNLVSGNARVTVSTDNGEVAMLPAPKRSWFDANPVPTAFCEFPTYGRTFVDTDTGISYVCDPSREKWLSLETVVLWGEQNDDPDLDGIEDDCDNGNNPINDRGCNVAWGFAMGPNSNQASTPEMGLYVPYNTTITAVGFSTEDTECTGSGSFDLEIWGTGSNAIDEPYTVVQKIATGISDTHVYNDNNLDVDVDGDQYTLWGIDNNCGGGNNDIENWNMIIYLKWRHDNP